MVPQLPTDTLPFALLGVAARSGTGKTTLLKRLIPELKHHNLQLGLIKHTHHRIVFDNRGTTKDIFAKGVDVFATSPTLTMAASHQDDEQLALIDGINYYRQLDIDLLLIEGFKLLPFPKIELHRQTLNQPLLYPNDKHIIALATDQTDIKKTLPIDSNLAILNINSATDISQWIMTNIMGSKGKN